MTRKKLIVLSSPSGGGKSTVAGHLMKLMPDLEFSVSATTRGKRNGEENGKHYYFLTKDEFEERISLGDLVEFEEIFGNYYGTLKSEIDAKLKDGKRMLFDVDVKGALSLKKAYPELALLIFIAPPDLEVLEARLRNRGTETEEQLSRRIARARIEIQHSNEFDFVVVNDDLKKTFAEIEDITRNYC